MHLLANIRLVRKQAVLSIQAAVTKIHQNNQFVWLNKVLVQKVKKKNVGKKSGMKKSGKKNKNS